MIKLSIKIEELPNGMMSLYAEGEKVGDITTKEAITFKRLEEKVVFMVKGMSDDSSHSMTAEGENAKTLMNIMRKMGGGDGNDESKR